MNAAGLHLIVRLAGDRVALPAADLDSVVEIDALTPVPLAPPHVVGLAALRSRVLTVIDGRAALGFTAQPRAGTAEAVMLEHEGHAYAVLVDGVEDAADIESELEPLRSTPSAGWARVARGIVTHAGEPLLVVAPAALIGGPGAAPSAAAAGR